MTNCTEENNLSSSSTTPTEVPEDSSVFDNFTSMNLELSNINEEDMRILRRVRITSPPNICMTNEVDDHSISGDEKEDTSVSNQVDPDEVNLPIVKCPVCDFNIEVSTDRSVDYDAYNMNCPVCDESLGEDAIRMVQNTSFPISQKVSVNYLVILI
ncbi:uncharacterized protein [Medicago truncatula]|uniref:uncharacterized protein n=1 Tax=Medicago truncatula TaxID=3880 RepID=UPI00196738BE|nr:uncharacterized protein LOC120579747 [Medicago truncatula]